MASYSTIPKETEPLVAKKQSNKKWIGAVAAICLFSAVLGTYARAGVEVQAPASFSSKEMGQVMTTGTFLWDVKFFPDGVNTLDISGDGTILAAGGIDEGQDYGAADALLVDPASGQVMAKFPQPAEVTSLAIGSSLLAVGTAAHHSRPYQEIPLYNLTTRTKINTLNACAGKYFVSALNFRRDTDWLAAGCLVGDGPEGAVEVFKSLSSNATWRADGIRVNAVAWSRDGQKLVVGGVPNDGGNSLRFYDAESGQLLHDVIFADGSAVNTIAFSPDGKHLAVGGESPEIVVIDAQRYFIVDKEAQDSSTFSLDFDADSTLAAGTVDSVLVYGHSDNEYEKYFEQEIADPDYTVRVNKIVWSPTEAGLLFAGSSDGHVRAFRVPSPPTMAPTLTPETPSPTHHESDAAAPFAASAAVGLLALVAF